MQKQQESIDYTERIWRYQDNAILKNLLAPRDYTERIWRYQDNNNEQSSF